MIEIDDKELERLKTVLAGVPKGAARAISSAANRAASAARTEATKQVRAQYIIKAQDVRSPISIEKASVSRLTATLRASGRVIPLSKFRISPRSPNQSRPLRAQVKKGSSGGIVQHAFVAKMPSGHAGVYMRKTRRRLPIKELFGPSVPHMIGSKEVMEKIEVRAAEVLEDRLEHEITRLLRGYGK
jgi:hypothetical protein